MTIASEIEALGTNLQAAKTAVTTKGGTVGDTGLAGLASEIATIPSGSATVEPKDINFYDYDGTLVESWTLAELANKTELPTNPTHAGLTAQGWNWTLADLKADNVKMDVGQMYIPTDGKTHLFVEVDADHLTPNLAIGLNGTATVDWGDGTATTTLTGSNVDTGQNSFHTYAAAGSYDVTIDIPEGSTGKIRGNQNYVGFLWKGEASQNYVTKFNIAYGAQLKHLQIGARMELGALTYMTELLDVTTPSSVGMGYYTFVQCCKLKCFVVSPTVTTLPTAAFNGCRNLEHVVIPRSVITFEHTLFQDCTNLKSIALPPSVQTIAPYDFQRCAALTDIKFSSGLQTIDQRAFYECTCLGKVTLPPTVTTVGSAAFENIIQFREVDCSSFTTIPSVTSTSFGTPSDGLIIKVPSAMEADFKAASGWSSYASYIVGV